MGRMKIQLIHFKIKGKLIFLKRRLIPYGLREAVKKVSQTGWEKDNDFIQATLIISSLKADGKIPRICNDFYLTLSNKVVPLKRRRNTTTNYSDQNISLKQV